MKTVNELVNYLEGLVEDLKDLENEAGDYEIRT